MKAIILAATLLLISACSSVKEVKVATIEEPRVALDLAYPPPLSMEPINWRIVTAENVEIVLKEMEKDGFDPVLFSLTDKDYENLSVNMAKIRRQFILYLDMIAQYKRYYEDAE